MAKLSQTHAIGTKPFSFGERLREISMFFDGTDRVHQTMRNVAQKLNESGISYAIAGGMAVNAHKYVRTTGDVDFLVTANGLSKFLQTCVPATFQRLPGRPRRFLDPTTDITFDLLVTGLFPGSGKPGPIAFPDPNLVGESIQNQRFLNLKTLVELKLAAGRYKDFGDVVELIRFNSLDEVFAEQLNPSVRDDYIECVEEMRREEEYENRLDRAFEEKTRENDGSAPKA